MNNKQAIKEAREKTDGGDVECGHMRDSWGLALPPLWDLTKLKYPIKHESMDNDSLCGTEGEGVT